MFLILYINKPDMKTLKFKTNIKCNNCIAKVKPFLDNKKNITEWNVDIDIPDKILTVTGEDLSENNIIETLEEAGYSALKI